MAKKKTAKTRRSKRIKPKSFLEKIKHWLEKRGQGLPMTTIVIIIIVLIVLAVVIVFFFGQFTQGQDTAEQQQQLGLDATTSAKCSAYANGLLPAFTDFCNTCPKEAVCTAQENKIINCGIVCS